MRKYIPNKYVCYLYVIVPLIINTFINYSDNEDIWYIMRYGKIILEQGFIHTDILSIHSGLHIVIQQSFSNVIFYLIYKYLGNYGLFLLCELCIGIYLFLIYKISMMLGNKKVLLSVLLACISCFLLELNFITPRPQLFTYINLLLVMYIMESFIKNNKTKLIYFLPLISLVQMNLHGALWYFIFLFILPYIAELIIQKNKDVWKIIIIVLLMFLVGFINPYTYENVFFPFTTYSSYLNEYIVELHPIDISSTDKGIMVNSILFYIVLSTILLIYIYYKKGKLAIRHLFLLGGTTILALANIRSIPIFILGSVPPLANYLKDLNLKVKNNYIDTKKAWMMVILLILVLATFNTSRLESKVKAGGDYLNENYNKDIVIYTTLDYGSYIEYLGFHAYMDTRAEVFLKKANKKTDIFKEIVQLEKTCYDYKGFIDKYKFTHMIVEKDSCLYYFLKKDNVKVIFEDKEYVIFEINRKE